MERLHRLTSCMYYGLELAGNPRYQDEKRLTRFGFRAASQSDEDGIIAQILHRVGPASRTFVEIGVGDGLKNNTCFLLLSGWKGAWMEADRWCCAAIRSKFATALAGGRLQLIEQRVTAENVETLLRSTTVDEGFDVLSIDIDGNDYWAWKAIVRYQPRVVVVEYNAKLGPHQIMTIPYRPDFVWDSSCYFGASLKALELLGAGKGYRLVGCNFTGVNAFFVRDDLVGDHFLPPFTAENHYEPARYDVLIPSGHRNEFHEFEVLGA
ncbi:MAG: hypothetical protein WB347_00960 [Terriglobales bacterium]